jgi:hypothetical protein
MEFFTPTTAEQEARALTAACLQVIATGWPVLFFKMSAMTGLNGQQTSAEPDIPAMIRAAADMAAQLTHATAARMTDTAPADFHTED